MVTRIISCFALRQIADSGQCFRWNRIDDSTYGIAAFGRYLEVCQKGDCITFGCDENEFEAVWKEYFDLDNDYEGIIAGVDSEDAFLKSATEYASGMRILKQELWEMIISFLISQNNNIPRIKKSIEKLSLKYGKRIETGGGCHIHAFPSYEELSAADKSGLADMGLGYRDEYILEFCRNPYIAVSEAVSKMNYDEAMRYLMSFKGIGKKVASCICLFGLHMLDACPIDTWMQKIIDEDYHGNVPQWMTGKNAGIYQQYAYFYKRDSTGREGIGLKSGRPEYSG